MNKAMRIVKPNKITYIITILAACTAVLMAFLNIDISDGIGFARGQADAQLYFGLAKANIRNGDFIRSVYWMLLGSRVAIDSEIKWNKAQPYVNQFEILIDQNQFKEALNLCPEIDQLIRKYDWDDGVLRDCGLLRQNLLQNEP